MMLLTKALRAKLLKNGAVNAANIARDGKTVDFQPVVKFFNPCGAATWLVSEMDEDGNLMFGLCDLGMGCPELGHISLHELSSVRLRFGLRIERDMHFKADKTLTGYADEARAKGRIAA